MRTSPVVRPRTARIREPHTLTPARVRTATLRLNTCVVNHPGLTYRSAIRRGYSAQSVAVGGNDAQPCRRRADNPTVPSEMAVCSACGGDVVHLGSYPTGPGDPMTGRAIEVGLCLACGEAIRLTQQPSRSTTAAAVLVPPPT